MAADTLVSCSVVGALNYNSVTKTFEVCSGATNTWWSTASSPRYFFVMTSTSHSGNLGGVQGAHKLCLDNLKAQNWNGKTGVNLHGGTVWAWLCNGTLCEELEASTTYTFARAGSASSGGGTFTTNLSSRGPGDSTRWSDSAVFGATQDYWTGRGSGSTTLWPTSSDSNHCTSWTSDDSGISGQTGNSNETNSDRWFNGTDTCDTNKRLLCFVSDDGGSGDKDPDSVDWADFTIESNTQTFSGFDG